ncbi:hypothetical protein ACTXT7_013688 [Hymenolepis weldensis]
MTSLRLSTSISPPPPPTHCCQIMPKTLKGSQWHSHPVTSDSFKSNCQKAFRGADWLVQLAHTSHTSNIEILYLTQVHEIICADWIENSIVKSNCYQSPHHYQTPQLACWPAAALDNGSIDSSPTAATGAALYNPYLAAQGRVGTPGAITGAMGSPSDVHQVLAALAAATTSPATMKDSRWLTLEVCRQYQRKMCSRDENECKFAHPPPHVDVQNGRVICCYDSIKKFDFSNSPDQPVLTSVVDCSVH